MDMNPLPPAVMIGGPPHAGKSVLTYSLMRALRQYGVEHYVMRACPDGEGHWTQEVPRPVFDAIRHKGSFSHEFVQRVCTDLQQRQLPFLVDVGGLPQDEQFQIFTHCTHAILLLKREPAAIDWPQLVARNGLDLLAELTSEQDGPGSLATRTPIVRGTITGLQRGSTVRGEPFASVVERLMELFGANTRDLSTHHLAQAPVEPLYLPQALQILVPGQESWEPEMLPRLLAQVSAQTPRAVYGSGPHWVYSALAAHVYPAPFYQFDARLGWLEPLALRAGSGLHNDLVLEAEPRATFTLLHSTMRQHNLAYANLTDASTPELPGAKGLIINGKMPLWLTSSLVRFYQRMDLPWIAGYYPQRQSAIVVYSRVPDHHPGECIPIAFHATTTDRV